MVEKRNNHLIEVLVDQQAVRVDGTILQVENPQMLPAIQFVLQRLQGSRYFLTWSVLAERRMARRLGLDPGKPEQLVNSMAALGLVKEGNPNDSFIWRLGPTEHPHFDRRQDYTVRVIRDSPSPAEEPKRPSNPAVVDVSSVGILAEGPAAVTPTPDSIPADTDPKPETRPKAVINASEGRIQINGRAFLFKDERSVALIRYTLNQPGRLLTWREVAAFDRQTFPDLPPIAQADYHRALERVRLINARQPAASSFKIFGRSPDFHYERNGAAFEVVEAEPVVRAEPARRTRQPRMPQRTPPAEIQPAEVVAVAEEAAPQADLSEEREEVSQGALVAGGQVERASDMDAPAPVEPINPMPDITPPASDPEQNIKPRVMIITSRCQILLDGKSFRFKDEITLAMVGYVFLSPGQVLTWKEITDYARQFSQSEPPLTPDAFYTELGRIGLINFLHPERAHIAFRGRYPDFSYEIKNHPVEIIDRRKTLGSKEVGENSRVDRGPTDQPSAPAVTPAHTPKSAQVRNTSTSPDRKKTVLTPLEIGGKTINVSAIEQTIFQRWGRFVIGSRVGREELAGRINRHQPSQGELIHLAAGIRAFNDNLKEIGLFIQTIRGGPRDNETFYRLINLEAERTTRTTTSTVPTRRVGIGVSGNGSEDGTAIVPTRRSGRGGEQTPDWQQAAGTRFRNPTSSLIVIEPDEGLRAAARELNASITSAGIPERAAPLTRKNEATDKKAEKPFEYRYLNRQDWCIFFNKTLPSAMRNMALLNPLSVLTDSMRDQLRKQGVLSGNEFFIETAVETFKHIEAEIKAKQAARQILGPIEHQIVSNLVAIKRSITRPGWDEETAIRKFFAGGGAKDLSPSPVDDLEAVRKSVKGFEF